MPVYFYLVHGQGGVFGVHEGAWSVVEALVARRAASYRKVSSVAEARTELRAAAAAQHRSEVLALLDKEDAEMERKARLEKAARLQAEFKSKQQIEVLAEAEARAADEHHFASFRATRVTKARRLVEAAALQLGRSSSLSGALPAAPATARAASIADDAPPAALYVSSSRAQAGGLAQCIILFTPMRVLWVNVRVIPHGSHAQAQLSGLLEGLTQAHARAILCVDVHLESAPLAGVLSGANVAAPKLRRLANKISTFTSSNTKYQLLQQPPPQPVIEMARGLLANAHVPSKTVGLKRLRSI
jgi:hypothetical protein